METLLTVQKPWLYQVFDHISCIHIILVHRFGRAQASPPHPKHIFLHGGHRILSCSIEVSTRREGSGLQGGNSIHTVAEISWISSTYLYQTFLPRACCPKVRLLVETKRRSWASQPRLCCWCWRCKICLKIFTIPTAFRKKKQETEDVWELGFAMQGLDHGNWHQSFIVGSSLARVFPEKFTLCTAPLILTMFPSCLAPAALSCVCHCHNAVMGLK